MKPQTTIQILRCLTLGRYTARVVDGRLETEGPQPLAGPLPASIKARRDELVAYLLECCGGTWPAAPGSEAYTPPKPPQSERIAEVLAQIRRGRVA